MNFTSLGKSGPNSTFRSDLKASTPLDTSGSSSIIQPQAEWIAAAHNVPGPSLDFLLKSVINNDISMAHKIISALSSNSSFQQKQLPVALKPIFESEEAGRAALGTVNYMLGEMYRLGDLIQIHDINCQGNFGHIGLEPGGAEQQQKIEEHYKKAADYGHAQAVFKLFFLYFERKWSLALTPPFIHPLAQAKKYYHIAEKMGVSLAERYNHCERLSLSNSEVERSIQDRLRSSQSSPSDLIKEDVQPLLDAAEAGFPDAQYHLGELYRVGDKDLAISPDVKLAEKYLRMAFAKHHPRAAYSLGQMMESQSTFFVNKEADAILMYEIASEGGVEPAALRLGEIHEAHSQSLFSSAQNTRYAITSYEIAAKSEVIQIRDKALAALKKLRPLSLTELGNASKNLPEVPQ